MPSPPRGVPAAAPTSSGAGFAIALIVLVLAGLVVFAITRKPRIAAPGVAVGVPRATLTVVGGPLSGQTISLAKDDMMVGRSAACDVVLPGAEISRQHARLRFSGGGWFVQDLGSKIGLQVNGQQTQAARLKPGDQIKIGENVLLFN